MDELAANLKKYVEEVNEISHSIDKYSRGDSCQTMSDQKYHSVPKSYQWNSLQLFNVCLALKKLLMLC
ncbi:hypothetical protein CDL15_Pgr015754 [Punica granatum]|uniref:Uncharacterized protein n=1 Tax=Punica granatum TaxID=22663 RepID=A0A218XPK7_PUNGR|nr:hypothetical protein CDL15_Pgr015754 [Punica granatum]